MNATETGKRAVIQVPTTIPTPQVGRANNAPELARAIRQIEAVVTEAANGWKDISDIVRNSWRL
jgi:hypothetical protein